jgi:hypothetical protein
MTHQELAQRIAPFYWGALALCGAIVGTGCGLLAWRLTRPHG